MNTANILQTLVAMGLVALRENLFLGRIANREYEQRVVGASRGSTVNIVIPSAVVAQDVVPANVPPTTTAVQPTVVPITLDTWKEGPFEMTDKDYAQVDNAIIPVQATEAVKAVANAIEDYLWGKANFAAFAGTEGVTPFAVDDDVFLEARRQANVNLMPMSPRYVILDPAAEAKALALSGFRDLDKSGDPGVTADAVLGRKLGATWLMSQRVPTQAIGTHNGAYVVNGAHSLGATAIVVATGTGTMKAGEIITFSGDTNTYAVQADYAGGAGTVQIRPGLKVAKSGSETIAFKTAFVKNLLMQRDGLALAMAPLADQVIADKLVEMKEIIDEIGGYSLRVELTREHKRWRWSYDALFGGAMPRVENGAIIAG